MRETTMKILQELEQRYPALKTCMPEITQAASALVSCFWQDGKLLACGNGGSAADCEHIVGELMKAFRLHRRLDTDKQEANPRNLSRAGGRDDCEFAASGASNLLSQPDGFDDGIWK